MQHSKLKDVLDNKSQQKDPQNPNYYLSRGFSKAISVRKAEIVRFENQKKEGKKND